MKKVAQIIIGLLFFQTGCQFPSREKRLDGLWFFTHSSATTPGDNIDATPASFLFLQSDHTYTSDFKKFEYGHWKKNDSLLLLTNDQKLTTLFPIRGILESELMLKGADGYIMNFEKQPAKFSSSGDNPFSFENNKWRMPAIKKESEEEIKGRLRNHFRFHELYFKWALDAKLSSVDVRSTPSPIKIYGNGFSLKKIDELPASWRSYFYDEEDCRKANNIIENIFRKEDIAWTQTDNKYKMFISAFQQLEQKISR